MRAMMIDIESLSLRPDAYVVQVGYCIADLDKGEYLVQPHNRWLSDAGQEQRHKDIGTIEWWLAQDRKVAAGVFNDTAPRDFPGHLFQVLKEDITRYEVAEVWASPAMYDLPVLTSLWQGKKPWRYSQERCLMTLASRFDPYGAKRPAPNEKHHDAAADAHWQMEYLIRLHQFAGACVPES